MLVFSKSGIVWLLKLEVAKESPGACVENAYPGTVGMVRGLRVHFPLGSHVVLRHRFLNVRDVNSNKKTE